jgi:hypothetical protein
VTEGRGCRAPTVRLWAASVGGSLLLLLLFAGLQRVEIAAGLGRAQRLVKAADELPMRVVGFSHHLVAAFFLLTSPRARTAAGRGWIALMVLAGGGLAFGFRSLGGAGNPLCLAAFYLAFIAHVFRDEIFFYDHHVRQAGRDVDADRRRLTWVQVAAVGALGLILVPALVALAAARGAPWLPRPMPPWLAFLEPVRAGRGSSVLSAFPAGWTWVQAGAMLTAPFLAALVVAGGRLAGDWTRVVRVHAPVVTVLGATIALAATTLVLGAWVLNLVILVHFVSWFLFTTAGLRTAPASPAPASPVQRLRSSLPGFWTLHGGLALAILALIAADHFLLGGRPIAWGDLTLPSPVSSLLDRDAFYLWTILHVALSWTPRGPRRGPPGALAVGHARP